MDLLSLSYGSGESAEEDNILDATTEKPLTRKGVSNIASSDDSTATRCKRRRRLPPPPSDLLDERIVNGKRLKEIIRVTPKRQEKTQKWVRSFPHVEGNWPSHVFLEVAVNDDLNRQKASTIARASEIIRQHYGKHSTPELVPIEVDKSRASFHLSLSRTFVLKYEEIHNFVDHLQTSLIATRCLRIRLHGWTFLVNDEGTRSFVSIPVQLGKDKVVKMIRFVDDVVKHFGGSEYYKDPLPHVSVASFLGDVKEAIPENLHGFTFPTEDVAEVSVKAVICMIGNKTFRIPLRENNSLWKGIHLN